MNLLKGLVAGLIAGVIGAAAWALIAFYANFEIGYLAWGIGALVGFAFAFAGKGGGAIPALLAVLVTVASIGGGKYLGSLWSAEKMIGEMLGGVAGEWSDENCKNILASGIFDAKVEKGELPPFDENSTEEFEYPDDVLAQAEQQWNAMSPAEQQEFSSNKKSEFLSGGNQLAYTLAWEGFKGNLGPIDIIFFVLGVITAWQIAFMDPIEGGAAG